MGTEGSATTAATADIISANDDAPLKPPAASDGIIPRAVYDLFHQRQQMPQGTQRVTISMSYLEIYNEEARDLLATDTSDGSSSVVVPAPLQIRDNAREGVQVVNLTHKQVTRPEQVCALMNQAATKRATASTAMNAVSSRSHAICTLHVTIAPLATNNSMAANDEDADTDITLETASLSTEIIRAKLTLVDLAGSERIKRTGAAGQRMKEGININKGLFVLGQCVSALSELGQQGKSASTASTHIPYRDSKLTRLLQDSLGGNSKTIMVACISPADTNVEESINTLRYASRTRNIQNSAIRNVTTATLSVTEAVALQKENAALKLQLAQCQARLFEQQQQHQQEPTKKPISVVTSNPKQHETIPALSALSTLVDVAQLGAVHRLQSVIASLESKVLSLEAQQQDTMDSVLIQSVRADKWQLKFEELAEGVTLSMNETIQNEETATTNKKSLVLELRQEIGTLRSQLQEALTEAAVSRATTVSLVSAGDFSMAGLEGRMAVYNSRGKEGFGDSTSVHSSDNDDSTNDGDGGDDEKISKEEQMKLTTELLSVSGGIESKEAMAALAHKEFLCLQNMRVHFESAVQSLQSEVDALEKERTDLLAKTKATKSAKGNASMKARMVELEAKMKELRQKAQDHKKSLRLRQAAEEKCTRLQNEIAADKAKRVALQKKLKEQQSERRSEKLQAKTEAARLMRDSNALKRELQKVRDAAEKQKAVLQRKATAALNRQKRDAEFQAKRERKLSSAKANSPFHQKNFVSDERCEELANWLEREIESAIVLADLQGKIRQQKRLLHHCGETLKVMQSEENSDLCCVSSLEEEITTRTSIINELGENVKALYMASWTSPKNKEAAATDSPFMDPGLYDSLSESEAKAAFTTCFQKVVSLKQKMNAFESKQEVTTSLSISRALARERQLHEDAIVKLKMDHSEAIMDLLNSTKGSIEQSVRLNSLNAVVDDDFQKTVENMLEGYLSSSNKASANVQDQLEDVRQAQEGMKAMVESVAADVIGKPIIAPRKSKPKTKKKRLSGDRDSILEEIDLLEAESGDFDDDNSQDSDWDPNNRTPGPRRRFRRSADSHAKSRKQHCSKRVDFAVGEDETLNDTMETLPESQDSAVNYHKLKKVELQELLRVRNLPVGGKKADLLERLESDDAGGGSMDLAGLDKEDVVEVTDSSARQVRRGLQKRDMNAQDALLPETPPQSTHKMGGWSSKKTASVRRSTIFSSKKRHVFSPTSPAGNSQQHLPVNLASLLEGGKEN